jgi:hypothetical protein
VPADGSSTSGYYGWRIRPPSGREIVDRELLPEIIHIHRLDLAKGFQKPFALREARHLRRSHPNPGEDKSTPIESSGPSVEISYDDEAGSRFYAVDALNIIGIGCLSREDAERAKPMSRSPSLLRSSTIRR